MPKKTIGLSGCGIRRLGISVKTLWVWQKKGIIRAVRLPTGKLRYPKSEVERILKEMGVKDE